MRALVIGAPVMLASLLVLKLVGPVAERELCQVVSASPDDRLQIETWAPADWNPITRLDPFAYSCGGPGWLVVRDRRTGERVGDAEAVQMWSISEGSVHWGTHAVGVDLAGDEITVVLPR